MDAKFRHRLVGAAVWVALAVVFIPAVFDGAGYPDLKHADMRFLGEPELEIERRAPASENRFKTTREKIDLQKMDKEKAEQPKPDGNQGPSSEPPSGRGAPGKPAVKAVSSGGVKAADSRKAGSDAAQQTSAMAGPNAVRAPASGQKAQGPAEPSKDRADPKKDKPQGPWMVETAAYKDKRSAEIFIAQLKQAGYPARLKLTAAPEYTFFTVEIGPIGRLGLLKELQSYLSAQRSMDNARVQPAG